MAPATGSPGRSAARTHDSLELTPTRPVGSGGRTAMLVVAGVAAVVVAIVLLAAALGLLS
jgi:hypothetical protein